MVYEYFNKDVIFKNFMVNEMLMVKLRFYFHHTFKLWSWVPPKSNCQLKRKNQQPANLWLVNSVC